MTVSQTHHRGHATEIVRQLPIGSCDALVTVGGDGTVFEALQVPSTMCAHPLCHVRSAQPLALHFLYFIPPQVLSVHQQKPPVLWLRSRLAVSVRWPLSLFAQSLRTLSIVASLVTHTAVGQDPHPKLTKLAMSTRALVLCKNRMLNRNLDAYSTE